MEKKYSPEQYDQIYIEADKYWKHYTESPYFALYKEVLKLIKDINILELGCGTGQFAEMIFDSFKNINYTGLDFSKQAIKMAQMFAQQYKFKVVDIEKQGILNGYNYDVAILLEVLEHLNDKAVLNNLRKGSKIIASVPNYDSQNHVRFFESIDEVKARYINHITIKTIKWVKPVTETRNWILFSGIIK